MLSAGAETNQSDTVVCIPVRASTKPSKQWREKLRKQNPAHPNLGHPRVWLLGDAIHAMQPTRFVNFFKSNSETFLLVAKQSTEGWEATRPSSTAPISFPSCEV